MLPGKEDFVIKDIIVRGTSKKNAIYGENTAIVLDKEPKTEIRGSVLVDKSNKKKAVREITALLFSLKKISGHVSILINGSKADCMNIEIIKILDIVTGKESKVGEIKPLGAAEVRIKFNKEIFVEDFEKIPELGRFLIYDGGKFAGIGIIGGRK